jgi:site-specific DNA-methyltransferase (adenine-specific)
MAFVVCCLIPARPDTAIWHKEIFRCASEIRFLKGRVRFVGAAAGAPFPSALVIFGQDTPQKVRGWDWKTNTFTT